MADSRGDDPLDWNRPFGSTGRQDRCSRFVIGQLGVLGLDRHPMDRCIRLGAEVAEDPIELAGHGGKTARDLESIVDRAVGAE